ncbi:hypothetical protein PybrP1_006609, partial [[Pythium] brassicae (nom. inval.)]
MSEFVRRTHNPLTKFVELVRCQAPNDYRPNKVLVLVTLERSCKGYDKLSELLEAARYGVPTFDTSKQPRVSVSPPRHPPPKGQEEAGHDA